MRGTNLFRPIAERPSWNLSFPAGVTDERIFCGTNYLGNIRSQHTAYSVKCSHCGSAHAFLHVAYHLL